MKFSRKIINWYNSNKRKLPWRKTTDPYNIWLSEIILQQTRIEQGTDYYLSFISQYPDIESLANASEEEILKLWQGLGYYSRARNLHATARDIVQNYNGNFPESYEALLKLKGIGEYTAAAIASIAFHIAKPVVDGNVLRFLSRIFGMSQPVNSPQGKSEIKKKAEMLIDPHNPGDFNQALMEYGSLVCKPQSPKCGSCIFNNECIAFKKELVEIIPVKTKSARQTLKYFNYIILKQKQKGETRLVLNHRTEKDIWQNLYDFPLIETKKRSSHSKVMRLAKVKFKLTDESKWIHHSVEYRHILSHQIIYARFYIIQLTETPILNQIIHDNTTYKIINLDEINSFPIPRLVDKFITENIDQLGS